MAIAACTTSAGVDAKSSGGGGVTSGGSAARGPSARTIFGTGSGWPAPAARSRARSAGSERLGRVLFELDLELAEARREADAVEHGDLVVDDFADLRTLLVAQHHARAHAC